MKVAIDIPKPLSGLDSSLVAPNRSGVVSLPSGFTDRVWMHAARGVRRPRGQGVHSFASHDSVFPSVPSVALGAGDRFGARSFS